MNYLQEEFQKKEFHFSIIMAFKNSELYIKEAIESLINQSLDFETYVQLILVDDGSEDNSKNICLEYSEQYPENIILLSQENKGVANARNQGLHYATGKYINFLDSDDYFSKNTLDNVKHFFDSNYEKTDVVSIPIIQFDRDKGEDELNSKFKISRIIDLNKEFEYPQISISSSFIKKSSIEDDIFKENLICSEDTLLLNEILLTKKTLGALKNCEYYYRKRLDCCSVSDKVIFDKQYLTPRLKEFHKYLIDFCVLTEDSVPPFIQHMLIYDLKTVVQNKLILFENETERKEFFDMLAYILSFIDESTILENDYLDTPLKIFFNWHKNNVNLDFDPNNVLLKIGSDSFDELNNINIKFNEINLIDEDLVLSGKYTTFLPNTSLNISHKYDDNEADIFPETFNSTEDISYLSSIVKFKNEFEFKIPAFESLTSEIRFKLNYHKNGDINDLEKNNIISTYLNLHDDIFEENDIGTFEKIKLELKNNSIFIKKVFKFSIIIAVYNVEEYLNECVDSIIYQTLDFKDNTQLILVDDCSTDDSLNIAYSYQEQYPQNILVLSKENGGQASARNLGLKYALGKYVNFLDSDDYLSKNTLEKVYLYFENHEDLIDVIAIPMMLFERVNQPHRLNYKFKKTRIIDLRREPNNPLLSSSSAFIKYESIKDYTFDEEIVNLEDALVINKILLNKKKYGVLNNCKYYYRQRLSKDSTVDNASLQKEFFTDRLKRFYMNIISYCLSVEGKVPLFIQYLMAYDLQWILKKPDLEIFENKLEYSEFWFYFEKVLSYIDVNVVYGNTNISGDVRPFFLSLLGEPKSVTVEDNNAILKYGRYTVDKLNTHKLWLDIVEIKNNYLNISGVLSTNFSEEDIDIVVVKENDDGTSEEFISDKVKYNAIERRNKIFLETNWVYKINFDVSIPLKKGIGCALRFFIIYSNPQNPIKIETDLRLNNSVRLSDFSACISKKPYIVVYKNYRLYVVPYKFLSMLRYEYSNIRKTYEDKPSEYINSLMIKTLYFAMYPFLINKRIWLFGDRPENADDNAKHLFKYSSKQNDGIKKYFIVNKDSESFNEMKKIDKHVVPFESLKHKILYLFAEKTIYSYVNENFINPFFNSNFGLYKGLVTSEKLFLQHGVTKDDVSQFIKKYNQNLSLIVTVSDLEKNSFLKEGYNYDDDIIQVVGFPRYDNLDNKNLKKQILFMPTWRLDLENDLMFKNSDYYHSLENVLNNEELIEYLIEHDYKLIFKPHPELLKYLDLMEINEHVEISLNDSYQKLFNESSLLITDFSSVFFDFAYLKKPVIYYQPNDDYHYGDGYFDYETMGFGPVINEEEDLFNEINSYISKDCSMEEKYKNRVKNFFKYTDKNNCKRTYEWILKH